MKKLEISNGSVKLKRKSLFRLLTEKEGKNLVNL